MIPVFKPQVLAAAPSRSPGFVSAWKAATVQVDGDVVYVPPEAYADLRARFPTLPSPREYPADEAVADAAGWLAPPAPEPKRAAVRPTAKGRPAATLTPTPVEVERQRQRAEWGQRLWAVLHVRPLAYRGDRVAEEKWLWWFRASLPCGECKSGWTRICDENPIDLSSPEAYARWLWTNHNLVSAKIVPPNPRFAWSDAVAKYGYPAAWTREELLLTSIHSPGDVVVQTGLVRDLHAAHPGRYRAAVRTHEMGLWANNPNVVPATELDVPREISLDFDDGPGHFAERWRRHLSAKLGVPISTTELRGDIHPSEAERAWPADLVPDRQPYWLLSAGYKTSYETKAYPHWQQVVDGLAGRVRFVRVGHAVDHEHRQPPLSGVLDLVGKTTIRDLVRLVYHADGVACHESLPMHLAAAVPTLPGATRPRPCVVVVGGRSPVEFSAYPGHISLHVDMDCNAPSGACWKSYLTVQDRPNQGPHFCLRPSSVAGVPTALCQQLITPSQVVAAVEGYLT